MWTEKDNWTFERGSDHPVIFSFNRRSGLLFSRQTVLYWRPSLAYIVGVTCLPQTAEPGRHVPRMR